MSQGDPILTVAQTKAAEKALFDAGTEPFALMQRAGTEAAGWIWRASAGRPVTILCGPGNNGGDGYVIAEWLRARGCPVGVVALFEPKTDDAKRARDSYAGRIIGKEEAEGAILVDCVFGTGQDRPLDPDLFECVVALRERHAFSIAVDLPSGCESDSGRLLNDFAPYDMTIALGAWKPAHWIMPSMARMGTRKLARIGLDIPIDAAELAPVPKLGKPAQDAHKYTRGLVGVIGGRMPGAAMLAARAAMHSGAGYVRLNAEHKSPQTPDALVVEDGSPCDLLEDERVACFVTGPGLGRDEKAGKRLAAVLKRAGRIVLDADALVLLQPGQLPRDRDILLTPHEGELARLCETFGIEGEGKRARATALARVSGCTVLAKGPDTILVDPQGRTRMFPPSPSWLSTAGTGDALAGLAAGRMATGADTFEAASQAVCLHAQAARLAGPVFSADLLIEQLPAAYGQLA